MLLVLSGKFTNLTTTTRRVQLYLIILFFLSNNNVIIIFALWAEPAMHLLLLMEH
jgi:hypothetical protein